MLLKLGGALVLLVLPTHLGLQLRHETERGDAAGPACVRSWGRMLHFRAGSDLLFPPFLLWVTHWLRLGEIFEMWSSITTSKKGKCCLMRSPIMTPPQLPHGAARAPSQRAFWSHAHVCLPDTASGNKQGKEKGLGSAGEW